MKKLNYDRPLAEVIEINAEDIITTSRFTTGKGVKVTSDADLDTIVNAGGSIMLK